ncbi:maleylpyruvate isomerase N-terminal domain-containing protein [Nocardiopsis tropica]|uniref:Maleylpyruvate isomerase N-terminal domain-containing protein n=1 Tax=Nocardiopsis tropica TaxID=109330 RepID=A0ABU7L209_9ACTN|nr:maleylpyruvate isomerase N-terminal domain-containing protein [Nocardiopsis umidischolae]MEE2055274.1 maleylpyruvate isomerase N-terminal domain-containing protein [Nocardiopsis umidischolae]
MFSRDVVLGALAVEVASLDSVLWGLSEEEAVVGTRCAPWDVAALAAHTVRAMLQVEPMLVGEPAVTGGALVSAGEYYRPDVRFSAEVNAHRVGSAVEAAARRTDAGESGRLLRGRWSPLVARLAAEPVDRVVVTRHGDRMLLSDFLVTRVVESVLHGLDLADALGRDPWVCGGALDVVRGLLFGQADPAVVEGVVPGALSGREAGVAAVRSVTGRGGGVSRGAWEGAGVRFLALG